ncbi:autotransporter domain protein [Campylobacter pinnipediorum subsp. caledonicus]|uniref:autotransporter outer membrane beta-barrel domain-containing protein n=1 Tax=Campylobacter pinnipediorum TaxID=1965231 RepID=UPI00099550B6|nr:autotransporter outer membrane beta-barrel domain-containing protein [Campylobacter pinnipediorum]AQW85274.1 autotransporter domain protein [Campylobacter pinnipediorum subsp. caledonicus]
MKISKIACATLLGAIIATGAFAENEKKQDYLTIKDAKDNIVKEIKALKDSLKSVKADSYLFKNYSSKFPKDFYDNYKEMKELHSHVAKLAEYFDVIKNNSNKKDVFIPKNGKDTCDKDKTENCLFAIDVKKNEVYLDGEKIAELEGNRIVFKGGDDKPLGKYKKTNKPLDESSYSKLQDFINKEVKKIADKYAEKALENGKFKDADKKLLTEAIVTANELNNNEAQTVSSLLNVKDDKNKLSDIIEDYDADEIAMLGKVMNKSLEDITSGFNNIDTIDAIISNTGLATNSRLAKLSNPLNDDLALAYAIKNLSDNKFADNADTLSSVVKEYTNRFNYDSNLWGNIMGGKAKLKSQANTNTYGFMLGYDKAFDNMIIGGYAGYTNAKSSSNTLTTKSDNYHFGAYTRMYIDQNEIDAKVSYGKGKNKLDRKVIIDPDFDANGKYDTKFLDASIDYGHIFDTNNNSFMKPMIGLEYSHVSTKGFKETGKVPVSFKGTTVKTLSAKAAVEFRKYIANGNFLYITPGIQKELRKSMKDTELAFVNSTENIKYASKKDKHTFFTLKTGAEMKLTDNLSTNINFGVKAKSESKYYNGTVGLSYKF